MRLLIWNIQFFTESRIRNTEVTGTAADLDNEQRAQSNLGYIISTVREANPELFVVIEARSDQGNIEELANGGGPRGLLYLLTHLRQDSDAWCLVPPLRVNPRAIDGNTYTETVGVFWRNDRLQFTGPYVWPAARRETGPPIVPGSGDTAPYPAPWDATVPLNTVAAARCRFYSALGREVILADPAKFAEYARRPFLTTFTERAGQQRNIKLFSVHTKPAQALSALIQLTTMQADDWLAGDNEATVLAGDFNINLRSGKTASEMHHLAMFNAGGQRALIAFYKPDNRLSSPTVYRTRKEAEPTAYLKNELFDYGFVNYGAGAKPDPLPQFGAVAVNRVAGVTPGGVLPAFTSDMMYDLPALMNSLASRPVRIDPQPDGAVRQNGVSTVTTEEAHWMNPGDYVTVNVRTPRTFNGTFMVATSPSATSFTYAQERRADETGGGGSVDVLLRINAFRSRLNYGHIGPPVGQGTSDHLPVLLFV